MYNYIQGKIVDKTLTTIVVDNNGIGYEIGVSGNTLMDVDMGEIVKIYTYLYVREDEMSLYGFSRLEEKHLFSRLIDISGIGPKTRDLLLNTFKTVKRMREASLETLQQAIGKSKGALLYLHFHPENASAE